MKMSGCMMIQLWIGLVEDFLLLNLRLSLFPQRGHSDI
jgi:hypothetical protein